MTPEFDHVRHSFAASMFGRGGRALGEAAERAWGTSRSGQALRSAARTLQAMPRHTTIRAVALAVTIAATMQPLLGLAMPLTAVPALPWPAFALVGIFAAAVAWHAEAVAAAWPSSRFARWFHR